MSGITMCEGFDCPLKKDCYRYRAIPHAEGQSYFAEDHHVGDKCKFFWKIEETHKIRKEEEIE
jgi:hypothetical protein